MDGINDCSIDKYNRYRRLEQLQDPEIRELYLETVSLHVMTETLEQGRELTASEVKAIEESIDIRSGAVVTGELEFDILAEHLRKGVPFDDAVSQAREDAADIHAQLFEERFN